MCVEKLFRLREHGTNVRTELLAGLTTFLAMAYILVVNPSILGKDGGMPLEAVFMATALASALGCFLMGFMANYPVALAPGMGLNAYFTYTVVLGMGVPWEVALGAVFVSGVIFLLLTVTRVREMILDAIPLSLKHAIAGGIGLFIAFIGMKNAGIIVADENTLIKLTPNLGNPTVLLTLLGVAVTALFLVRGVKAGIFIGMIVTAVLGLIFNQIPLPGGVVSAPPSIEPTLFKLDILGALELGLLTIVFAFLFVELFDATGTLVGVANQAGLMKGNKLPRAGRALMADSISVMSGAAMGTSTVTAYIESSAGVAAGGRTGLTAITTGVLFVLSIFFFPIVEALTFSAAVTSPALIVVGILMAASLKDIPWRDLDEAIPAFLSVVLMPLTGSIATGIAFAFIAYPLTKLFAGKPKEVHILMYILAILFILRFIFLD